MTSPITELNHADNAAISLCIQKVATGPEYSKDLSFEEALAGMSVILSGKADPVQAAVVLIALRMKRETSDENKGVLQAILDSQVQVTSEAAEVVDFSDPYNGQIRGLPVAAFITPVIAACGFGALSQGVSAVGPKFGITQKNVLQAANVRVDQDSETVAKQLANSDIGWGYIDQKHYCPALYELITLRNKMIKRTVITTVEVLTKSICGKQKTHLITGYVHRAYPPVYAELARFSGYDTAAIVRGVEGGLMPSIRQQAKFYRYHDAAKAEFIDIDPQSIGLAQATRAIPLPGGYKTIHEGGSSYKAQAITETARIGVAALQNEAGIARDSIVYGAAIALLHLGQFDSLELAASHAKKIIASGDAYDKFRANLN